MKAEPSQDAAPTDPPPPAGGPRRLGTMARLAPIVGVAALAGAICWAALSSTTTTPTLLESGLPDAGSLTRWGLPVVKVLRDVASAIAVGALVVLSCCLPRATSYPKTAEFMTVWRLAIAGAAGWGVASLVLVVLTYSDIIGRPAWQLPAAELWAFVRDFPLGQSMVVTALLAAAVASVLRLLRTVTSCGLGLLVLLAALWAQAATGHTAGSVNHDIATATLFVHVVCAAVWVGSLLVIAATRTELAGSLGAVVRRYSVIATTCVLALGISGLITGALNLGAWGNVWSPYGALLAAKTAALGGIVVIGLAHRRGLASSTGPGSPGAALRFVAVELALVAAAIGTAVALSRSPGTGGLNASSTAEALLGFAMPAPLEPSSWFLTWRIEPVYACVAVAAALGYGVGVRRLRGRGDRWSPMRTASWMLGCALLLWSTNGAPGVYGEVLFSMHMVQHMTIATAVPVFLVLGAPISLATRTLTRRRDGSRGPREWLLLAVHSPVARILGHPVVACASFVVSLVAFYYSGLFELSLRSHTAHLLMVTHFLVVGYLFASTVVGLDPGPRRVPHLARLLLLMLTFGFHALFSVSLMSLSQVLASSWFQALDRPWGSGLMRDQYVGASLGWALGDYPLAVLAVALVVQWVRADRRESDRYERQAQRDGYQALEDYNERLRLMNQHGPTR